MAAQTTAVLVSVLAVKTLNHLPAISHWLLPVDANW